MKEYALYCQINGGKPYIDMTSTCKDEILVKLYDIISYKKERNFTFFVDNDFYNNIYNNINIQFYFKILVRDITDWQTYSKYEEEQEEEKENSKILYFQDYL